MKMRSRAVVGSAIAVTLGAILAPAASANPRHDHHRRDGVVFVQTDDPQHNTIVSYDRTRSGRLKPAHTYRTGGKGGVLDGSQVDHLASQGSLVRRGNHLFAVNAGSNTITNFKIIGDRLIRQQVISSGGEFPVSIAVSSTAVYVLNARNGGSLQGYLNVAGELIKIESWHRDLGFDPDASPEFTSTPAQISFTPDGRRLVLSTKGDWSSFETFAIGVLGTPSTHPVVSAFAGRVPFGFDFDRHGDLVATEAGTNSVAALKVRHNGSVTLLGRRATGQQATCWVVVDGDIAYVSNAGSATITSYRIGRTGRITPLQTVTTDAGTVDAAVSSDGRALYVQAGAAGKVDEFRIGSGGRLSRIGAVTVPNAAGGEGIVAS